MTEIIVEEKFNGSRIDKFLAESFKSYSRSYLQKLLKEGRVTCNGKACTLNRLVVSTGDKATIDFPELKEERTITAQDIPLDVLYEDDDILVVNKKSGMVVHPAVGNHDGTVVNALLGRDANFAERLMDEERPGIVHRLDKDTSGCLVVAKNPMAQFGLSKAFQYRKVKKHYAVIAYGKPRDMEEEIITFIGRHPVHRKKFTVVEKGGKTAISRYKVIKTGEIDGVPVVLLDVEIETGRTHQIRVHLAHKKLPVLGDQVYGGKQTLDVPRQMLHAWKISFEHPVTGVKMDFESPFPDDFAELEKKIK
ncbi:MAG TPA: RNA pseudouridine synthase [Lentisphaeria bacterium]|nr:MAG: hypothetical protein A2X48_04110 [Lentisphaerae bacterium GWF2_49_21]HBC85990.1 RNA pseudouridine synthase [Lentisphaeria bacterium]